MEQERYSWQDKVRYSWQERKRLGLTPLCALLALGGFATLWLSSPGLYPPTSGWELALNTASKDLILLPGVAPGALVALWLVPGTALVLFSVGIARLFWVHQRWLRIWGGVLTGVCLVFMSCFCFPLFPPLVLQHLRSGSLQASFWLTAGALLLSALGLLLPDPWWWIKVQPAPHAPGASASRRHLLSRALNLGGILLVGCAAGLDLGWLTRPRMTPLRVLSIGVFEIPFNEGMNALVWSPDGAALLECLSGVLRSWEMATGQVTRTYFSPFPPPITGRNPFGSIALSPNGRLLAAAMEDGVLLWEVTGGRLVQRLALSQQELLLSLFYSGVTWSPDGTLLATTRFVSENQAALFVLRASDLKQQARYPLSDISQTVAWSPDGRMLALVTLLPGPIEVWDISHGRKIWTYQPPRFSETTDLEGEISTDTFSMQATDIAWAPDSRRLAISLSAGAPSDGFRDQQAPVLIWDIVANHLLGSYQGHWGSAHGLAWAPDGTRLAAAGQDWTVQVWHAETGR